MYNSDLSSMAADEADRQTGARKRMKQAGLRWILPLLRYGLCAVALVYLYFHVDWHDFVKLSDGTRVRLIAEHEDSLEVMRNGRSETVPLAAVRLMPDGNAPAIEYGVKRVALQTDWRAALLSLLIFLPVPFLSALRLVWMLAIQDVRLGLWQSVSLTYAGNFFNFALPGTTGGDLFKAYYITRYTQHKTEAVTTIFLDRVIGLLGLMFMATIMFAVAWNRLGWEPTYRNSLASGLGLIWVGLLVGCLFVFSTRLRHAIRLPQLAEKLPAGEHLLRIGRATVAMRRHPAFVLLSLAMTLALQFLVVASGFYMARALGMKGGFELYFICIPIGFLIAAVPISPPQAFGVLEYAYIQFFTQGGLNSKSVSVAFALAIRLIQLVWALPGILVPLLGLHLPSKEDFEELQSDNAAAPEGVQTSSSPAVTAAPNR
ncbi:MAG: flippase-like domain-containing protein [Planctomycetes bacterium]|nr:flippase-like domain-containing protein [Planctomycetota bacterium]